MTQHATFPANARPLGSITETDVWEAMARLDRDAEYREQYERYDWSGELPIPAETMQPEDEPEPRLRPLVTSLWVAAAFLVAAHVTWVANGMPVPAFLSPVMEILNV